ncbi:MAG TPA: aminotransferase class V-fold PLP-dependent enzyme [Bacteroidia bacterium]|jgi:aromatic-L-amino-acid decarboxylase|nr:aminotransferase class V-fold PLP-dependent enzyme [Bacteroidia bacterium]
MENSVDLNKILELEKISRLLEPDAQQRKTVRDSVVNYTEGFINDIETLPAYTDGRKASEVFLHSPITEEAIALPEIISMLKTGMDEPALNPASGGHLGYIPGGGIYYSALGDYWADITNRYAGIFFAGPGAVRMENMLIKWTAELADYPSNSVGNLTSGGSIANLSAIVTARDYKKITSDKIKKAVIYLSPEVHHCIFKAIRIAGLAECVTRHLPLDEGYRIKSAELEKLIIADKEKGLIPFLVVASAGTTDTGSVDPLTTIGEIAKKHSLWYHVDAAYGGYFLLTDHGKKILKGIELSDSFAIDPHKGLFLPYGLGMVVVKNKEALYNSHYYRANYMQDTLDADEEVSPADLSPELTKHFRGLRLWLPLKLLGLKPFRACLEEKLLLTRYFYGEIKKLGFEVGPYPNLSVATYRYISKKHDINAFNKRLMEEVQKDGRVFISSTMLDGKFMLRLAVLSFRTHLSTIDTLLSLLKAKVIELEKGSTIL